MLISLTNANPSHRNKIVVINTDFIVSMHRNIITREDATVEEVTFVHCPPHGTWEVQETIEQVMGLIAPTGKLLTENTKKSVKKEKTKLL